MNLTSQLRIPESIRFQDKMDYRIICNLWKETSESLLEIYGDIL
jgi:hypothetical protein